MKTAFCVLAVLCFFVAAQEGKRNTQRTFRTPPNFYKAEEFVEMSESSRMFYTSGLMDGFYASALFGATDKTVANLASCTGEMDSQQISAIITKYVKDHPEKWHPLSIEAWNALNSACPGQLKIVN
jgi:hypothetical protein